MEQFIMNHMGWLLPTNTAAPCVWFSATGSALLFCCSPLTSFLSELQLSASSVIFLIAAHAERDCSLKNTNLNKTQWRRERFWTAVIPLKYKEIKQQRSLIIKILQCVWKLGCFLVAFNVRQKLKSFWRSGEIFSKAIRKCFNSLKWKITFSPHGEREM